MCTNCVSNLIHIVGASQSSEDRIRYQDKGMDYLAMFSSRGPTADCK